MKKFWIVGFVVLIFVGPIVAQQRYEDVVLPDRVMKPLVSRVARAYFKPSRKLTTIYLSDTNLKAEWLPRIRGVRFELANERKDVPAARRYVLILQRHGRMYSIGFGIGTSDCLSASPAMWKFRLIGNRIVGFRRDPVQWGFGCA